MRIVYHKWLLDTFIYYFFHFYPENPWDLSPIVLFVWLFLSFFQPSDSREKSDAVLEVSDVEGDTLDPQTGLFYRSGQSATDPLKHSPTQGGTQSAPPSQSDAVQSSPPVHPLPPQLQSKPQINPPPSSSTSLPATPPLAKKLPKLREQTQPKPQAVTQSPKDRPQPGTTQTGAKVAVPGAPSKPQLTPQLPKLQQAPTSHHRPLHTPMSPPPPLQAHHPVNTEKTASGQVRSPHAHLTSPSPQTKEAGPLVFLSGPIKTTSRSFVAITHYLQPF